MTFARPLAGLVGSAESLQLTKLQLSLEQSELAEDLVSSALRMTTQVNNLLDMARFESGEFRLSSSANSIEELAGSAMRFSRRVLGPRKVKTDVPANLPCVECDPVLIESVLVNLLNNAASTRLPERLFMLSPGAPILK